MTSNWVVVAVVASGALFPWIITTEVVSKPLPEMVIRMPPWLGPDEGLIELIDGAAWENAVMKPAAMTEIGRMDRRNCGEFIMSGRFEIRTQAWSASRVDLSSDSWGQNPSGWE